MTGPVILGPLPITRHLPPGAATRHPKLCLSPHTRYSSIHSQVPGLGRQVPGSGLQVQVQARTRTRQPVPGSRSPETRDPKMFFCSTKPLSLRASSVHALAPVSPCPRAPSRLRRAR